MSKKCEMCRDYIFLVVFFGLIVIGLISLTRTPRTISVSENRALAQFEQFTARSFLNGTFQDNLENSITDHIVASETIKLKLTSTTDFLQFFGVSDNLCANRYFPVNSSSLYRFNCDDHLIIKPHNLSIYEDSFLQNIAAFNRVNELADTYYYFINTPFNHNFETSELSIDIDAMLSNSLKGKYHYASFSFDSYDEFANNFYKSDHHWDHKGSYRGYLEIVELLGITDNILEPTEEITFDEINFNGSRARGSRTTSYSDIFTAYAFDMPEHTTLVNEMPRNYGASDEYTHGYYSTDAYTNHYGAYYGGDTGEVVYDFNQPSKENLLIIGDSFTNSINILLATHFNKTYDVDLRHYEADMNAVFDLENYIKEHNIDKILIMGYLGTFATSDQKEFGV